MADDQSASITNEAMSSDQSLGNGTTSTTNNNNSDTASITGSLSSSQQQQQQQATTPPTGITKLPNIVNPNINLKNVFDRKLCGHIFQTTSDFQGMTYKSRIDFKGKNVHIGRNKDEDADKDKDKDASSLKNSIHSGPEDYFADSSGSESEDNSNNNSKKKEYTLRQQMALTLRNWCNDENNTESIVSEGAIAAIISMSLTDDRRIRRYCAAAFLNLSKNKSVREALLRQGAVGAISHICTSMKNNKINGYCSSALVNLSLCDGSEGKMADDNVLGAFMGMMMQLEQQNILTDNGLDNQERVKERVDILKVCIQGLFNLTCVTNAFTSIDRLLKVFITLYELHPPQFDPSELVARALCNFSNIYRLRLRMIEEGAIDILLEVIEKKDFTPGLEAKVCKAMGNIADARGARCEMVQKGDAKKGAIKLLGRIAEAESADEESLESIASTIHKMALDSTNRMKIVDDNVIDVLAKVYEKSEEYYNPITTRHIAASIHALTHQQNTCEKILQSKKALALMKNLSTVDDTTTLISLISAYCNLLSSDLPSTSIEIFFQLATRVAEDDNIDAILHVIDEAEDPKLLKVLATLIYNLSCVSESQREMVVERGITERMVALCEHTNTNTEIQNLITAAISNLALFQQNVQRMVEDGVIDPLCKFLKESDEAIMSICALALSNIAQDRSLLDEMIEKGVVESVISIKDNVQSESTMNACSAILSSLTFCTELINKLFALGIFEVVLDLSTLEEPLTRRRCAIALCNLSCEPEVRNKMVDMGVIKVLSSLSSAYNEQTQQNCAICFCNLSCSEGTQKIMIEQGAMGSLMMIALVRAVTAKTKKICAAAMLNLINEETIDDMLEEGIIQSISTLCSLEEEDHMLVCAKVFYMFSLHNKGHLKICSRRTIIHSLFNLARSKEQETQIITAKAIVNLLIDPDTQISVVLAGGLSIIKVLTTKLTSNDEVCGAVAEAILSCVANPVPRERMNREGITNLLVLLCQNSNENVIAKSFRALSCLSYFKNVRSKILESGAIQALVYMTLIGKLQDDNLEDGARIIAYQSYNRNTRSNLVSIARIVPVIAVLCHRVEYLDDIGPSVEALCSQALEHLSWNRLSQLDLVKDGAIEILIKLVEKSCDPESFRDRSVAKSATIVFANLGSRPEAMKHLIDARATEVLKTITDCNILINDDSDKRDNGSPIMMLINTILEITKYKIHHVAIVEKGILKVLQNISPYTNEGSQQACANAICNLAKTKECRQMLIDQGVLQFIINMSQKYNPMTLRYCMTALRYLSAQSKLESGTVTGLINLLGDEHHSLLKKYEEDEAKRVSAEEDRKNRKDSAIQESSENIKGKMKRINTNFKVATSIVFKLVGNDDCGEEGSIISLASTGSSQSSSVTSSNEDDFKTYLRKKITEISKTEQLNFEKISKTVDEGNTESQTVDQDSITIKNKLKVPFEEDPDQREEKEKKRLEGTDPIQLIFPKMTDSSLIKEVEVVGDDPKLSESEDRSKFGEFDNRSYDRTSFSSKKSTSVGSMRSHAHSQSFRKPTSSQSTSKQKSFRSKKPIKSNIGNNLFEEFSKHQAAHNISALERMERSMKKLHQQSKKKNNQKVKPFKFSQKPKIEKSNIDEYLLQTAFSYRVKLPEIPSYQDNVNNIY